MNNISTNKQPSLKFIDLKSRSEKENIWEELELGLWKKFKLDDFLYNETLLPSQIHLQRSLFPMIHQVMPGVIYDSQANRFSLDLYQPQKRFFNENDFLDIAENFFLSLKAKKIGVHLSGGLDSSLIMALLRELNIPFVPIGLVSETFEFRTERIIQEKLIEWGEDGLLISMEEYPFYSNLKNIPKHQIPCSIFKSYSGSKALAEAFKERGCDVVLSGQGGDSLFVEAIKDLKDLRFNIGDEFLNGEEGDLIYRPLGLRLESFYADKNVIEFISNVRIGEKEDPLKLWARRYFKSLLITELSEFGYAADFFAMTKWGLHESIPIIKELFEECYDLTHIENFSPNKTKSFIEQDIFSFEYPDYVRFCSLLSVAIWYHSLMKK